MRRYTVISADGHIETPPSAWVKYVPAKWRDRAPRLIPLPEGGEGWVIEGQPLMHNGPNITGRGPIRFRHASYWTPDGSPAEGAGDATQRLQEQDADGIDAEVLFPPVFASRFLEGISDRQVYTSMISAYNTFLGLDYCSVAPDRLIGNAVIPVCGLDFALDELRRIAELGLRSVSFYQFPNSTGFWQREDDEFWSLAGELGVALSPHFGFGSVAAPPAGSGRGVGHLDVATTLSLRAGTHAPVYCLVQLIASGVFDRLPDIRFYFAETNASWLPFSLYFLDDNYALYKDVFGFDLQMKPSEYILRHCYFGIVRDPTAFRMRDVMPFDNLMWGSDFPHSVGSFPQSAACIDAMFAPVGDDIRRKVLVETPARFYHLDLEAEITPTNA
jgi:predicted TIM-barrel fold metal-dependent hydrolase